MFAKLKIAAACVLATALFSGAAAAYQYSRAEKNELDWHPGKRIVVEEVAGDIEVRGVKGDKVVIEGLLTVEADSLRKARAESGKLTMEVTSTRDEIRVVARRPRDWRGVKGWIHYNLRVPLDAPLTIKTVSGGIRVIGVDGSAHANSVSGEVLIQGASGGVEARSVSGNVRLKNCSGDVVAETVGGGIMFETAETSAEKVTLRAARGTVRATLPPDFSARVQVVTVSGKIRSDLPLKVTREDKKALKGTLGDGAADVRINTVSGNITLSPAGAAEEE